MSTRGPTGTGGRATYTLSHDVVRIIASYAVRTPRDLARLSRISRVWRVSLEKGVNALVVGHHVLDEEDALGGHVCDSFACIHVAAPSRQLRAAVYAYRRAFEALSITHVTRDALVSALQYAQQLRVLTIQVVSMDRVCVRAIADVVRRSPRLVHIALPMCDLDSTAAAILVDALLHRTHPTQLQTLDLSHNLIGDMGFQALADALLHGTHLAQLETLDLGNNWLSPVGMHALAGALLRGTHLTQLRVLDGSRSMLRDPIS